MNKEVFLNLFGDLAMKNFWLALLVGCFISGQVMARPPSLRSVKNLFVEQSSNLKQWSVNLLVAGALACTLMTTGCGVSFPSKGGMRVYSVNEGMPALHKHVRYKNSISQRKVDRHISWPKSNYLERFHTLTLYNHYHDLAILFDEKGIPYYGEIVDRR